MNASREKELLYSILDSIAKERNEMMQFIMRKIDRLDAIEENQIHNGEIDTKVKVENNTYTTSTIDNVEESKVIEPVESNITIENAPELVVEDIENNTDDNENVVELNLFSQSELENLKEQGVIEEAVEDIKDDVNEAVIDEIESDATSVITDSDESSPEETVVVKDERSMKEIIDEHNRSLGLRDASEIMRESSSIIPIAEIEREKDRLPRRSSQANIDRVKGIVVSMLKKVGKPVHVKEIHVNLNKKLKANDEGEVNITNLRNNILPRIMKSNKSIQRVTRGYYQYIVK